MANILAYIIGAAALGVTAAWIVGQKAEPASAPVAAAHPAEDRSVMPEHAAPADRPAHNPFAAVGTHRHPSSAPRVATAPSAAEISGRAVTAHRDDPERSGAGDLAHPDQYGRDYTYQTASMAASTPIDTQPADGQIRADRLARQPDTSQTTIRHTDGHLAITIVGSAHSSPAAQASVEPTVPAPVPTAAPASHSQQPDCTLYRGGNAYARLVLSQRGCKF